MFCHDDYKEIFNSLYNGFYNKYRLKEIRLRTDKEWEEMLNEVDFYYSKYDNSMVRSILLEFVMHFEQQEKAIRKGMEIKL